MAQNYDLTQTGPEVQQILNDVHPETVRAMEAEANLQAQIDEIVSGSTTVGLQAIDAAVLADGTEHTVGFLAYSSPTKADITFKEKDSSEPGDTVENVNSHEFDVVVSSESQTTVTYQASFTVQGVSKGTKDASVKLVYPIFIGSGVDYAGATFAESTVRPTPAGVYDITTLAGDHLMFDLPEGMEITKVLLYDDPSFVTEIEMETVVSSRTGLDGSAYTCSQSVGTFAAGTHTYKVS